MSAIAVGVGVSAAAAAASVAMAATRKPPKSADFIPVNLQTEQANAIKGNLASFGAASELASRTNTFNASEIQRMNELALPYYSKLQSKGTQNIMDWMSGKIPTDVSAMAQNSAASRASYGGFGGTGMGRNLVARDLGLNSLDIMSKGMDSATRWMQMNKAQTFDVGSLFLRPGESARFAAEQRDTALSYENASNAYDFQNDPRTQWQNQMAGLAGQLGGGMINYLGTNLTRQVGANGGPTATPYTDSFGGGRGIS